MRRYFLFFLLSGFAGLVYETVWLRLAMASYGVTAISLSIVVSVFMGGLALGSWLVSRLKGRLEGLDARQAGLLYAAAEIAIAVLGFGVPWAFVALSKLTARAMPGVPSAVWYALETLEIAVILLPACTAMGATLPLGVHAIARATPDLKARSFSYLYLANVLGAAVGTLLTAYVFIELWGFRATLRAAALANVAIALLAWMLFRSTAKGAPTPPDEGRVAAEVDGDTRVLAALFLSGLCSMGLEVVWTRLYTPFVGTVVYSFAGILAVYLISTFLGSALYRLVRPRTSPLQPWTWALVGLASALPLFATDWIHFAHRQDWSEGGVADLTLAAVLRLVAGIAPAAFALGFITPNLVDRWSGGQSARAGLAYSVNTIGCILGPLAAGFILLPLMSERAALVWLTLPFLCLAAVGSGRRAPALLAAGLCAAALAVTTWWTRGFEDLVGAGRIERDSTATTIASGHGFDRHLLVNGVGMTNLTPIVKAMAHFPLAALGRPAQRVLVICFGMGTSFRSALSWGVATTGVDLVPAVPHMFSYFHADAEEVLSRPTARVVADDGRRFLERSKETYDVIIIDPPPPVEAASTSLLYSREFYELLARHLAPDGILAHWVPSADTTTLPAMFGALRQGFSNLKVYRDFTNGAGYHMFASQRPLALTDPSALAARLPPKAAADFVEWGPYRTPKDQFIVLTSREVSPDAFLAGYVGYTVLSDDRPINEYYFLRRHFDWGPRAVLMSLRR